MSEEIKKEVQDAELNPEDLDKVAGGFILEDIHKCNLCGSPNVLKFFPEDICYYDVCSNPGCENAKKHGPKINLIGGITPSDL